MYEIFYQRGGRVIFTVRWEWLARLITHYNRCLDYVNTVDVPVRKPQ